jgi:ipoprotein LpqH
VRTDLPIVAAAVLVLGVAGCSHRAYARQPGTLQAGTVTVSIDGRGAADTRAVRCTSIEWMTTIATGDDASGVHVMLSNHDKPVADFVRFSDFEGFTGGYNRGVQGEAATTMTGSTYRIIGTAIGFADDKPTERTTKPFEIKVSC